MDDDGRDAAWVHAYLHRLEGDAGNRRLLVQAGEEPVATGASEPEWDAIVGCAARRRGLSDQPGSMPCFLIAAAAAGAVMKRTSAWAARHWPRPHAGRRRTP